MSQSDSIVDMPWSLRTDVVRKCFTVLFQTSSLSLRCQVPAQRRLELVQLIDEGNGDLSGLK